ncbi:MAG TPA: hypothetical protein VM802_02940 [Chitinophaga sp.]|uniref:DUF3108 domain-containing protein n=1 Tax=Chitinophaga sp. TaxID=1869181 RepID=UPI002D0F4B7F|nr:hypothetical protein [Chitinophaga sp.]HVI43792.1 hypothetical protein [Chitinophaga sp.]
MIVRNFKFLCATGMLTGLLFTTGVSHAQKTLTPGSVSLDAKGLKDGKYELACFVADGAEQTEIGTLTIDIRNIGATVAIYTTMNMKDSDNKWGDTTIVDKATFKPIYRSAYNNTRDLVLKYGKEVTGYYYDKKTHKKTVIKDALKEPVFDGYSYPQLLTMLPLTSGYSASLPVYYYEPDKPVHVNNTVIEEVATNRHVSSLTGTHNVWEVSVVEQATGDRCLYYIDKDTRRIWKIGLLSNGHSIMMLDKETDFNPLKSTFDREATVKMLKSGSAVISGQAFTRDNEKAGRLTIKAINMNPKQFAPQGTRIALIPYTDYFKEWMKLSEAARKKGTVVPLPKEFSECCVKATTVYDDKGHFEFVNLMPGSYLLYTEFDYIHNDRRAEATSYTDHYINGMYQGTSATLEDKDHFQGASTVVKKIVEISKEGEKVEVKLRKLQ